MDYTDKWLKCRKCGKAFLWDAGEQSWYEMRKFDHAPTHCKECRHKKALPRLEGEAVFVKS